MRDLISRQAAIAEIARWIGYIDEDMIGRIQIGLKKLPSAQPEIVRCKDCMHYGTYYRGNESEPVITHLCKWRLDRTMEPDDYCSHAERRTDGVDR